jgi:hypothetical protein
MCPVQARLENAFHPPCKRNGESLIWSECVLPINFTGRTVLREPGGGDAGRFLDKTSRLDYLKLLPFTHLQRQPGRFRAASGKHKAAAGMNIAPPIDEQDAETLPAWIAENVPGFALPADGIVAADKDDLDDFDEEDFDDEFDDDFEEELEDEYELSEFEDVTEDDLAEEEDDIGTLGGDFVDEDAEPEEAPVPEEEGEETAEEKKPKKGKAKPAKEEDEDDEDFDDED